MSGYRVIMIGRRTGHGRTAGDGFCRSVETREEALRIVAETKMPAGVREILAQRSTGRIGPGGWEAIGNRRRAP